MRSCTENRKNEKESEYGRKRIASKCVLASVDCESRGISDVSRSILSDMIYDDVTRAVMDDRIILQFGEYMHNYYGRDANKQAYIRQHLRQIARLVLEAQKTTPMQKLEDFFHPSNFRHVLAAVNVLAGYDSETKRYASPSVAIKLGHSLQKTCSIVENNAVKSGDTKQAESARKFLSVYQKKWTKLVSSAALKSLRESKSNKAKQVPVAQDVKRLYFHLEKVHLTAEKNLRDGVSTGNYVALARVMLARTILFNRRKPREVSTIQLMDFTSRIMSDAPDDLDPSVTELEKVMCRFFTRVDVRGDGGRKVPVFLKPSFVSALELLAESREACGVPGKNPFLFGRPNTLSTYRGSECIQGFIRDCGAQISEVLTSKNIRKHFGKMLQLMNLDENEATQIFGPNNKIQILRQCNDSTLDDIEVESEEMLKHGEDGPAAFYLQAPGGHSKKSVRDSHLKTKHTWGEAEVRAVERHLMRFIQEHKVPQKDDCIKCLEAESKALRNRSWKGVKDYVRNRITTLKRQSDCSQDSPSSSKRPRKADPQQKRPPTSGQAGSRDHDNVSSAGSAAASSYHQPAHGGATSSSKTKRPKSAKSSGRDFHLKTKHTWGEAEVRAVERHMMSLIQEHKVPQKDDCIWCLEAEPEALRNRSWKGVKDYVRNRITTLQRQSGFSRDSSKSRKRPRKADPQQMRQSVSRQHAGSWDHSDSSSAGDGAAPPYHQQGRGGTTRSSKNARPRPVKSGGRDSHHKTKHTWGEAEVRAVERHMMSLIQEHKVPQKDDCVRCLEAEPEALRNRSWKGVKDYVRNRITTLQRQSDCSQDSPKSRKRPRRAEESSACYQQL
ncbi:uncharacterized protein LOC115785956 isoform X2 [Archocentrus centrarchus]|uniref:uncharacterized protein LOC115785956 isoform X2 n=1 Tax=Archocentrus centrarchus TaxID=63155 RepID=UPI0011E9D9B1|nr:uncharacterized protein LOC115785956 isoform X2 [Archocentrus centrarchus]